MFVSCWKKIDSPTLKESPNMLETFEGWYSQLFCVLPNLAITLEGKTVNVEVEIIDANLDYNILLRWSLTHAMHCVVSSLFRVLCFPHQGEIVMVNKLSLFASSSWDGNVPYVKHTGAPYESVGARHFKDPTLMGIFPLPPLNVSFVIMILVKYDPWFIPPPNHIDSWGDVMPFSPTEINYVEIVLTLASVSTDHNALSTSLDAYSQSPCLGSSDSSDPSTETFPTDENIMEIMSLKESP